MDLSETSEPDILKEKATSLIDEYRQSNERPDDLLEAVDYLGAYCKKRGILIPEMNGKTSYPETLETVLWQFSLIADKLFIIKEYPLCCQLLENTLELLTNTSDLEEINLPSKNILLLKLSSSYLQWNKWQASIKVAQLCHKAGIETGDKLLEVQSSIILANASQREHNFIEAIYYNRKLLDIGRELNSLDKEKIEWGNQLECKILWNISLCFNSLNDFENALFYAKEYLKTVQYGSQENLTNIFSYTGKLERLVGNYPDALHMHEVELAISKRYKDKKGMSKAYGNIGLVYASMGNEVLSQQFLDQQFLIAKSLGNSEVLLDATKDQGELYKTVGKIPQAIESFQSLLALARENHWWNVQCEAHRNIGKLYQAQGTLNFAKHFLDEAMHRASECGMKDEKIDAEMHLAQVLQILGYHEEARKHFKEVIIFFEKLLDKLHHYDIHPCVTIVECLKNCCRDLQDVLVKLRRYKEALEIAELSRSRVYFNVLKIQSVKSNRLLGGIMPLTYPCIETALKSLQKDSVILYYALSASGFHLWMMTPERGIVKFITENSLVSCTIEDLVRDCVKNLSITKKGNRCCYDSENRRIILKQVEKNKQMAISRDVIECTGSIMGNKVPQGHKADSIKQIKQNINEQLPNHSSTVQGSVELAALSNHHSEAKNLADLSSNFKPQSSAKVKNYSTPNSVYERCLPRNMHSMFDTERYGGTEANQLTYSYSECPPKHRNSDQHGTIIAEKIASDPLHDRLLKDLFRRLLGQIEHLITDLNENTRIIFVPDGILNMVPFHLLLNKNKEPLYKKFLVSVLPCLAIVSNRDMKVTEISKSVAIGNSSLNSAMFRNINGDVLSQESINAEEELSLVSKILGIRAISGQEATKDVFLNDLPDADIAHIASLGSFSDRFLLLTPNIHRECAVPETSSYVIDMKDLSYLDLKAKLVILSGCNQCPHALSEVDQFNLDLATGFIGAGTDAVVVFLYSVPHKARLYIIHRLYRLLEKGNSVCQALRMIYQELNVSEDMSHPGYWGGVVLVGKDVFVDVRTIRKNALEHAVNEVTQLTRNSVSFGDNEMAIDDFDLAIKANALQSVLGGVLKEKSNEMALKSLSTLVTLSRKEIVEFTEQKDVKHLPAIKVDNDLLALNSVKQLLNVLGYRLEESLEEKDVTYLMLPCWNFDDILGRTLSMLHSLQAIRSLSEKATFSLSRCLADLDFNALIILKDTISAFHLDPDKRVFTTDVGISSLWLSPKMKRFLQDIGFIEINVSLFLRSGNPYEQLQNATGELISTCLSMYEDGKLMMSQLTLRKLKKPVPWMTHKPNGTENKAKNLLAKRIITIGNNFRTLNEIGRQWHDATLQSFNLPTVQVVEIGNENKETSEAERHSHGITAVQGKQGGTLSACKFPIIDKRNVARYERFWQREKLEAVFLENKRQLSRRKNLEIYKSFAMSDV